MRVARLRKIVDSKSTPATRASVKTKALWAYSWSEICPKSILPSTNVPESRLPPIRGAEYHFPLEDGEVSISRSAGKITLPCAFMLVAAMNPCPCGYLGDARHECRCSPTQIQRYRARISGPLLDRIDLHVEAPALSLAELRSEKLGDTSANIRERVDAARQRQHVRLRGTRVTSNARMTHAQIRKQCAIDSTLGDLLQHAMEELSLSARAYDRILKVARTIADLAGASAIAAPHLLEAIQYRSLDRAVFY